MAAFEELDWSRLDVSAIVQHGGLATIDLDDHARYRAWLEQEHIALHTLDGTTGWEAVVAEFGRWMDWPAQFGYTLTRDNCNLDALRDGFWFADIAPPGCVLEFYRADLLWQADRDFFLGWLTIAAQHSREQLALGRKFFTTLILPHEAPLLGQTVNTLSVPWPHQLFGSF